MTAATTIASLRRKSTHAAHGVLQVPGSLVVAAFLVNELLMGLTPWRPIPWAAFYFPLRALGVPFFGIVEIIRLSGPMVRSLTLLNLCRALLGIVVTTGTIWFSWSFHRPFLFDLFG